MPKNTRNIGLFLVLVAVLAAALFAGSKVASRAQAGQEVKGTLPPESDAVLTAVATQTSGTPGWWVIETTSTPQGKKEFSQEQIAQALQFAVKISKVYGTTEFYHNLEQYRADLSESEYMTAQKDAQTVAAADKDATAEVEWVGDAKYLADDPRGGPSEIIVTVPSRFRITSKGETHEISGVSTWLLRWDNDHWLLEQALGFVEGQN